MFNNIRCVSHSKICWQTFETINEMNKMKVKLFGPIKTINIDLNLVTFVQTFDVISPNMVLLFAHYLDNALQINHSD